MSVNRAFLLAAAVVGLAWPAGLRAQTNQALPALAGVLAHAADTIGKEDYYRETFNRHYAYQRERVTETRYSDGKLKEREVKVGTNSPSPAIAALPLEPYKPAKEAKKKGRQLVDVTELVTNILAHSQMTIVERQQLDGRSALLVDFLPPKKKIPEKNLMARIVNRAAGRAWVDEEDYTLSRLEAHLKEKLYLFAGFGAVLKGNYVFERERTADGIWFARHIQYNADVREFILYRTINYNEVFTNVYRPKLTGVAATTR